MPSRRDTPTPLTPGRGENIKREGIDVMFVKGFGLWLILSAFALTAACDNTIRGVGRDAQESGDAIEDAVN